MFLAFEADEHRVVLAPSGEYLHRETPEYREDPKAYAGYSEVWSPARPTVVYVGTVAIGLTIIEMSESVTARYVGDGKYIRDSEYTPPLKRGRYVADNSWTTQKSFPTGRLSLLAYSPYSGTQWSKQWHQGKDSDLSAQIPSILRDLKKAASEIVRQVEIARQKAEVERQRWEAQQKEWRRQEAEQRAAKALKESKDELASIIEAWARTKRIEEFFQGIESAAAKLPDGQQASILSRLEQGRRLIGEPDPLGRFAKWKSPEERLAEEPQRTW